jgi:hypothetical protein
MNENGLSRRWISLARKLQDVSAGLSTSHKGYSIVSVRILVDENGEPAFWTKPQLVRVEKIGVQDDLLEQLCE